VELNLSPYPLCFSGGFFQINSFGICYMFAIGMAVLLGLLAGVAVTLQGPMIGLISQRMGSLESVFIIHLSGAVLSGIPLLILRGGALGEWRSLPWYTFFAGGFGLVIVGTISIVLPRIGAAGIFTLIVVGQIVMAVIVDHYGWFSTPVRPADLARIAGIAIIMFGTWLVIRPN